jgi:tRNA pseudouridine55 synthase
VTEGFLAIDKPSGVTSHDVVARVRKATGIRRAGHAGTLDPMATGLVVVGLGRATRLIRFIQDAAKEYTATARFGIATTTLDADGEETERAPMEVGLHQVVEAARSLTGVIDQVPPMVSALKVDGRRLYELAREGTEIERQARPVTVHSFDVLDVGPGSFPDVRLRVVCGKGTYVRVLADDLAGRLGGRAHLVSLRRTRTGLISVDEHAVTLDELESVWKGALISPSDALATLPAVEVDEKGASAVGHGRPLPPTGHPAGTYLRVVDRHGRLLAVFRSDPDAARPEVVLV